MRNKSLYKQSNGHWSFDKQMDPRKYTGFIYIIVDKFMESFYLGKKSFKVARGADKGEEGNWKTYKSSSSTLAMMFSERPKEDFAFIVLDQYVDKGALSYAETWTLCHVEAPTKREWYNKRIEGVSWNVRENVTELHKARLKAILMDHEELMRMDIEGIPINTRGV